MTSASVVGSTRRRFIRSTALAGLGVALRPGVGRGYVPAGGVPVRVITRGPKHHWFGYYDKLQFDPSDRFVLGMQVDFEHRSPTPEDEIVIGMVDLQDGDRWIDLGRSRAWNWQQGCMLQWVPGSDTRILWNDREGDGFVCRILDVKSGERRTIPHAVYSVSPDGKSAVTVDFRRLGDVRPGYGYAGLPDPHAGELAPAGTGIFHVDLETGESKLIISVADMVRRGTIPAEDPSTKYWFNHLLFNPDGTRFIALHRWRFPGTTRLFTRLFTANPDGTGIRIVIGNGHASHFIWRDPAHILANSRLRMEDKWSNFLFEDKEDAEPREIGRDVLYGGGHVSYLPCKEWILNDTYPQGADRLQTPHLYHVPSSRRVDLGHFPLPAEYSVGPLREWRVDTHPRLSRDARRVCIDAPHGTDGRQLHLLDISGIVG